MDLNESLYGETHSKIMSEVEKEVNLFQEKHQKWFDDNSEEGGSPDDVHQHYILQWDKGFFGYGIPKSANMPENMQNELSDVLKDTIEKFSAE